MGINVLKNTLALAKTQGTELKTLLNEVECAQARNVISKWPFYRVTPLLRLDVLAKDAGLQSIYAKDESKRLPLKSFKMLGAVYALACAVKNEMNGDIDLVSLFDEDMEKNMETIRSPGFRVVCATDGNHGTALAWAAQMLNVSCTIYLPDNVSPGREQTISDYGAEIIRVSGSYDEAVNIAHQEALKNAWIIIQDVSLEGYAEYCRYIMSGYTLLAHEAYIQMGSVEPTHVFVQAGVGGFAAATSFYLYQKLHKKRPKLIVVESELADCVYQSMKRGERTRVPGPHNTMMCGIACGEVSELAWDILRDTADFVVTIDEEIARRALRLCTEIKSNMEIGETGVAGLAATLAASRDETAANMLGLDKYSEVLTFITEGVTDPDTLQRFMR